MFASKDTLLTRPSGYNIARSVRLRSSASAYFNRTPASSTSSSKYTLSMWVKLGAIQDEMLFAAGASTTNQTYIRMYGGGSQAILWETDTSSTTNWAVQTNAVYRDPSAWYHLVFAYDSSLSGLSNQAKIYVNGVQASVTTSGSGTNSYVNTTVAHYIGRHGASSLYFDGYIAETQLIDGQQLTPSSFGSTNAITGVWQPAKYTGTYGTNGFYLNFSDNSNNTATTIGKDYSGNGNNWTPNNISVTAGVTYDSMTDVPTLTSATAANYCVWNPLDASSATTSNANLTLGYTTYTAWKRATIGVTSGKWYWEITPTSRTSSNQYQIGIALSTADATIDPATATGVYMYFSFNGNKYSNGSSSAYGASYDTNDVIGVAFDADAGTLVFYKNNTSQGTAFTGLTSGPYFPMAGYDAAGTWTQAANFGQRPFSYTPPTGFVALNTYNLPTSTITNGAAYMAATLYTGNGTSQTISNAVNGVSFQPDWVWYKGRTTTFNHALFDSIRGTLQRISSNLTAAESTTAGSLTSFNSNGFSVGSDAGANQNTDTYVAWQWKAGTTSASNTNGTITSTVSAGATQGFSVVTYTGTGANATVGHGLGVAPSMILFKIRSTTGDWVIYHTSISPSYFLQFDTLAKLSSTTYPMFGTTPTAPTSTVFSLGTNSQTNGSSATYVAYCFAAVAGYSAFGSYTGNGSTDGPFVYTGFRPRFFMTKCTSSTSDWHMTDTSRYPTNSSTSMGYLDANTSAAEGNYNTYDGLSNGFKVRDNGSQVNGNGATYIYMAFAENPFKNALAR